MLVSPSEPPLLSRSPYPAAEPASKKGSLRGPAALAQNCVGPAQLLRGDPRCSGPREGIATLPMDEVPTRQNTGCRALYEPAPADPPHPGPGMLDSLACCREVPRRSALGRQPFRRSTIHHPSMATKWPLRRYPPWGAVRREHPTPISMAPRIAPVWIPLPCPFPRVAHV